MDVNDTLHVWTGQIYARNGIAETASPLVEEQAEELADCEGLVVRVRGDGQVYCLVLTTGDLQTCSRLFIDVFSSVPAFALASAR